MWTRRQAVLFIAAAATVAPALALAGPTVASLPRWLTLGTLGIGLLAAGGTYEAGLARLRSAGRW